MEPYEEQNSDANTIVGVTARLMRWGRLAPSGLARVEYVSARAQEAALENLRREFQSQNIPFHEIELTPDTPALRQVDFLRETLGSLPPGVVSITGLNRAFPADVPLLESLGVLNFNRDTLVHFNLRQIWWLQGEMANAFRLYNYDFDRFFLVRLHLTEIPSAPETPRLLTTLPEGEFLSCEEAEQTADYYNKRFYNALSQCRPLSELMSLCVQAFQPLRMAGQIDEAGERQIKMFVDMDKAGYNISNYISKEMPSDGLELIDADSLLELGQLRYCQGNIIEAHLYFERDMVIKQRILSENHPSIAVSLNNLAAVYDEQGDYEKAEAFHKKSLAIQRHALPKDHPDLAYNLNNLAVLYAKHSRYEEAETYYKEALEVQRASLSYNEPSTAMYLNNLAGLYETLGRCDEATPLFNEALATVERALGAEHPATKMVRRNIHFRHLLRQQNQRLYKLPKHE